MSNSRHALDIQEFLNHGAILRQNADSAVIGWGQPHADDPEPNWRFWHQPYFVNAPSAPIATAASPYWHRFRHAAVFAVADLKSLLESYRQSQNPVEDRSTHQMLESYKSHGKPLSGAGIDTTTYTEFFQTSMEQLNAEALHKVVLYTHVEIPWRQQQRATLLSAALKNENLFTYGIWNSDTGWVGATPERLFEISKQEHDQQQIIFIDALAGTTPLAQKAQLLKDLKLIEEQQLVVDDIIAQLSPFGQVRVSEPEIFEAPPLAHRFQKITFVPDQKMQWEQMVRILHPTAAVGGFPRTHALALLSAINKVLPRASYGAPFGVCHKEGSGLCVVAIRGVEFNEKVSTARFWVGGGVTKNSELDAEVAELNLKAQAIYSWLGL